MALPHRDKKPVIKLPTCTFCNAIGKHYSYTCRLNPKNYCKHCKSINHTTLMCPSKPRKLLKKESDKTRSKRTAVNREWFILNPPTPKGTWECYLQITPECPRVLTRSTITLEHVRSKARYPELKFDVTNLKPSCSACNKSKQSLDLEDLVKDFPRLQQYIT